jgi:hypothetical protein
MPVTNFSPARHGFAFSNNNFLNHVLPLPGGGSITTRGRCGGMAFAALDYYSFGLPVPKNPNLPSDGTLLADYIYKRLIDSFSLSGPKFVTLTLAPDHPTWVSPGLTHWTKVDETANVRRNVDAGAPMVLGLIEATNLGDVGNNHQVVAYGYGSDPNSMPVFIYDDNYPGQDVILSTSPANPHYEASTGETWRGFFVEWYSPNFPDYLVQGALLKDQSSPKTYVIYGGAKFWIPSPDVFNTLGFSPSKVRSVGDGSMAYIADVPGDGTLLRETNGAIWVVYGGAKFHVPDPATLNAVFPQVTVHQLWDGALNNIPGFPVDGTLLRETNDAIWVVYGGAKFHVPDPATLNSLFARTPVHQLWNGALVDIGNTPADGSLFREQSSQQVYVIAGGRKVPAPAGTHGSVNILWDGALANIP